MMLNRCPRCGQPIPAWQPIHLSCLVYRLRGLLLVLILLPLLSGGFLFARGLRDKATENPPADTVVQADTGEVIDIHESNPGGGEVVNSDTVVPTATATAMATTETERANSRTPTPTKRPTETPTDTPRPAATPTPRPTRTPTTTPLLPTNITSLRLINGQTDRFIQNLTDGDSISLSRAGRYLNIEVVTEPGIESVLFYLDDEIFCYNNRCLENGAPYAMAGDLSGDYYNNWDWQRLMGAHVITVQACTQDSGGGTCYTPLTVSFTVTK